jgi:hypothetical protein
MNKTPTEKEVHWHLMPDTDIIGVMEDEMAQNYKTMRGMANE